MLKPTVAQRSERNAINKINPAQLKRGENLIERAPSGFALICIAASGQPLKFVVKDPRGAAIPTTTTKKGTKCWSCGVDAAGDTHCWQIPCPVITGPWKPAAAAQQNFRQ
ncbi:hypothetical protein H9Q09_04985 [Aurantimonas sp. DM33-3]|nr:hypothetical protein [Aurantimonas sp. DM33-3]